MGLSPARIVWPKQTHGNTVGIIDETDCGSTIPGVDALVFARRRMHTGIKPILCVHTADCVPLLFADPDVQIFAAAHAGWRGTLSTIATRTVMEMIRNGAAGDRIVVSIGPHIGPCCYDIPDDRAALFNRQNGLSRALAQRNGTWYLDLASAIRSELITAGIAPHHIDISFLCTSCTRGEFYSFRRDGSASYGEMMGFITWKK
jgi:hypothetical protein